MAGNEEGSKRPPGQGQQQGGVLHQRRYLPFSPAKMAVAGLIITAGIIGYFTIYAKKKPEATARDVAKVTTGVADPENTRPRK